MRSELITSIAAAALLMAARGAFAQSIFTDDERARVTRYWSDPGRLRSELVSKACPLQVRLTPGASTWFLRYQHAVATGLPPTVDASAAASHPAWEPWVRAKLTYDRAMAQQVAVGVTTASPETTAVSPQAPGPMPQDLFAAVGNAPPLAAAVTPMRSTVTFDDGESFLYEDHVLCRSRFAYYRFPRGTIALGPMNRDLPDGEIDPLFAAAGLDPSEVRVAKAVSKLEGGFESVNTYDTGFISIGFIQFISGADGRGSLIDVLKRERKERPADFESDFALFGLSVAPDGTLVVVDPETGVELNGADAVLKVIDDKRLTAPFQRAGRHSSAFRIAQIETARADYWPANDPVTVNASGAIISGTVRDVIHSEAGMAALFDRKINTGALGPLDGVIAAVMAAHQLTTLAAAGAYEREIVEKMKYRTDFLLDTSLSQPAPLPQRQ